MCRYTMKPSLDSVSEKFLKIHENQRCNTCNQVQLTCFISSTFTGEARQHSSHLVKNTVYYTIILTSILFERENLRSFFRVASSPATPMFSKQKYTTTCTVTTTTTRKLYFHNTLHTFQGPFKQALVQETQWAASKGGQLFSFRLVKVFFFLQGEETYAVKYGLGGM